MPFWYSAELKTSLFDCKEVYVFGLKYRDSSSSANWAIRSVEIYVPTVLPGKFDELIKVPLDIPYNFIMSLDKDSNDKEIERLGVEVRMFWELLKVENALTDLCQKWC